MLAYNYFKSYYKMISTDLSKQQALKSDAKAMQQINFTANLNREGITTMFFILKKQNKPF